MGIEHQGKRHRREAETLIQVIHRRGGASFCPSAGRDASRAWLTLVPLAAPLPAPLAG